MTLIYLAEISAYDGSVPGEIILRYSSGLGFNAPDAPGFYAPRIEQPALLERNSFSAGTTNGQVETGYGEMVLVNQDGELDGLLNYGFDGRLIRVLVGESEGNYADFEVMFLGTMQQPTFTMTSVNMLIRDRLFEFDKVFQEAKYGGTNVLPAGLDGTEDIKGQPKPRVFGVATNFSPPNVNTAKLIYQLSTSELDSAELFDEGLLITAGSNYADATALESTAPTAGQVRFLFSAGGSYARLGAEPSGQITANAVEGATAGDRTAAQILYRMATEIGGIAPGDIVAGDVTGLDADNSAECGIFVGQERQLKEVMGEISQSVGAWFGFDRLGKLRMRRFEAPSGTPTVSFLRFTSNIVVEETDQDIISIELASPNDNNRGTPAWQTTLRYWKNYTVQSSLNAVVTSAVKEFLKNEFRSVVSNDSSIKVKHLLAPEMQFTTLLATTAAAQAECDRLLALYKVRRDRLSLRARLTEIGLLQDLGDVVKVKLNRFGLDAGKLFTIIGIKPNVAQEWIDLELWG